MPLCVLTTLSETSPFLISTFKLLIWKMWKGSKLINQEKSPVCLYSRWWSLNGALWFISHDASEIYLTGTAVLLCYCGTCSKITFANWRLFFGPMFHFGEEQLFWFRPVRMILTGKLSSVHWWKMRKKNVVLNLVLLLWAYSLSMSLFFYQKNWNSDGLNELCCSFLGMLMVSTAKFYLCLSFLDSSDIKWFQNQIVWPKRSVFIYEIQRLCQQQQPNQSQL